MRSPKWRRIPRRRQRAALDPRPDRAVLAPAHARALLRRGLADRQRRRGPTGPTTRPTTRSGAEGAGWITPARARCPTTARTASSSPSSGEFVEVQVEARRRALGRAHDRPRDALQQVLADLGALDEEDVQALVAAGGEQQRPRRQPVAPRAARLLVVGLDRARDGLVADGPHVGLVDAHPERVGGDDHRRLAGHEAPLRLGTDVARQPRVVGDDLDAQLAPEPVRQPVALRARAGVDDRRQRVRLGQRRRDPPPHDFLVRALDDREREVRAVEPGRDVDRLAQPQARARCRPRPPAWPSPSRPGSPPRRASAPRRRAGSSRAGSRAPTGRRSAPRRPRTGPARAWRMRSRKPGEANRSGATYKQPHLAGDRVLDREPVRARVLLRVDQRDPAGRHARQRLDLVLHQRDQRRDHQRQVRPHQRRQLVTERLARAGGHHHQDVATGAGRLDRLALPAAGTPGTRRAPQGAVDIRPKTPPGTRGRRPSAAPRSSDVCVGAGGSSSQASDTGWRPYRAPRSAPRGARVAELLQSRASIATK